MRFDRRRLLRPLAALVAMMLAAAACSLPTDDEAAIIAPEELPDALRSDLITTTTVEPGPRSEPVELFLLAAVGERSVIVPVIREIDPVASFQQRIGLLFGDNFTRSEEEEEQGWSNALREFQLVEAFVNDDQIAIIDMVALDEDGEPITVEAQILADAIAQVVFTATGFPPDNQVLAVRILSNGARTLVPTLEGDTEDVVNRDDFVNYTIDWVPPTTTVPTTTSTTTTTEPADDPGTGDGDGDGDG
ncbi:MAG: hypothetical protein AAF081_16070 [Actinomycetota bacterium]